MGSLSKYARDIYSQHGEDGILSEIFKRLGVATGWFVDVGAWDGKHLSNTAALVDKGWVGVEIEADPARATRLEGFAAQHGLVAVNALVTPTGEASLNALLKPTSTPEDFDLLSIDIDSFDYQVWQGLETYCPKVVIIETNSSYSPRVHRVHGDGGQGTSFRAMVKLGREKGYVLVCHTGNAIFVRADLAGRLNLPIWERRYPRLLYTGPPSRLWEGVRIYWRHPWRWAGRKLHH